MLLAENKYGRYAVPESSAHRPAAQAVLRGGIWEPDTIALIREKCGTGDVVHAGTYFGDFLPGIASALAPGAILWAFEPSPINAVAARKTIAMNGLENVHLVPCALGEDAFWVTRFVTHDGRGADLGGLSRVADGVADGGDTNVLLTTVDATIPAIRTISVIQLDVEGYEKQALCGAMQTIGRCLPLLILEDWDGRLVDGEWFRDTILGLGYVRKQNVHENAVFSVEE